MIAEKKSAMRGDIRRALRAIPKNEMAGKSRKISLRVAALEVFERAKVVLMYMPCALEVDISILIDIAFSQKKSVCFPVITGKGTMKAVEVSDLSDMASGEFGILRPEKGRDVSAEEIDLVVAPGLAFDRNGGRLGKGGGFYDRFLRLTDAVVVAPAFSEQVVEEVPSEENDVPVDILVSEKFAVKCERKV